MVEDQTERTFRYTSDATLALLHWGGLAWPLLAWATNAWDPWVCIFLVLCVAVAAARHTVDTLRVRRGYVRIDLQGLVAGDWRGRTRSVRWAEVAEVRVNTHLGAGPWWHNLQVRTVRGRPTRIGPYLWDMDELTQEIIDRAGLAQVEKTWYGTVSYGQWPLA